MKKMGLAAVAVLLMLWTFTIAAAAAVADDSNEYSIVFDEMTDAEVDEMCRVMFLECRGESFEGKVAVAEVILNRVLQDDWPDTVHEVLSQRGQFSTYRRIGKAYDVGEDNIEVTQGEIHRALMYAYENGRTVLPNENYVYFDTSGINGWNHVKIGNHYFGEGR